MADFFKGLAGGFQTGLQFGNAMQQRQEREELAAIMREKPVAAGPDFAGQFRMQGLEQGPMPQAEPIQDTQSFMGQQYAQSALTPERVTGLRYGAMADVIAQRDPAAALRMRQEQVRMQREAELAPLQRQQLEGQIAGQGLTQQAQRLNISEAERKIEQEKANRIAQGMLAEISAAGTPIDTATANRIAKDTGADMTFVTDAVLKQYNLTEKSANDLIQRQLTDFNKAAEGGIPALNKYIAERLDPDKTDNIVPAVVQGADGKLRVMYGGKPLPGYQAYGDLNQLSAAFQGNIKRDPLGAAIQISTLETQAQARKASEAAVRASDSTVGLRNTQAQSMREMSDNATQRADIVEKFQDLTGEEQAGAKGQGLIKQFNLLNAKAGAMVPLGAPPKAATGPARELSDLDKENLRYYRDWVKDPKNSKLPQGQKDAFAAELGVTQFIKRDTAGPQAGVGSNPYAAPQQGVDTTRAPAPAAPAPAALTTENTKLLGRAGNTGYNVQLPDGTTQVMSISQLNKLGYQFPGGTGLQRAWYEDLLPR